MIHPRTLKSLEYEKIIRFLADLCISAPGREMALKLMPLPDAESARKAFTLYEESCVWAHSKTSGQFAITPFPDVRNILDRTYDNNEDRPVTLDLDAFWALREMLRLAQKAHVSVTVPTAAQMWPHLLELALAAPLPEQLLAALNRCISDDGFLKDESSPELYRLRAEMRSLHQNCLRKVKDFAQQYNMLPYLQDEFMTLSSDRYVLPLKSNFKGKMQGIIHDWSQTGETCYFEPIFLVEINNRLRELKHEEREEERKILDYLGGLLNAGIEGARSALALLGQLDFLNAKRRFAEFLDCHCPTFTNDDEGIGLLQARHPGLALARQKVSANPAEKLAPVQPVRPLDIILRPGDRVLVITGGNAGGKTVCLKTLGLNGALAMSGLPIPAGRGSHLPWFDRMDAFIGDEQSLDDNVSTFTAQIEHLAKAWKHLDSRGLVLLDEFGAGTDPAEGAALAQAVLDGLLDKKTFVLSATHFPALKSYALTRDGVRAASMLFDPATRQPLFRLAYDQVGSSHALTVAAEHGLPESLIERARHYLLQDGQDSTALLQRLNDLAATREEEISRLKSEEAKNRTILKEKKEKLERERSRLQDELRSRISELMKAWQKEKITAKQAMKEMSALRAGLKAEESDKSRSILPHVANFIPGQVVHHAGFNKNGKITDIDERRKRARIDLDGVSLWADMKDLRQPGQTGQKKTGIIGGVFSGSHDYVPMTVDVRGKRADEALAFVERSLDKAILAGYSEIEIIHGRGTGALRREIHEFLRTFPAAANVELAPEDRGGDGMTIVTLR